MLEGLTLIRIDDGVLARAASLQNSLLRSLDAIHLAAALTIGDHPVAFITYDARLAKAAAQERLPVWHPGVKALSAFAGSRRTTQRA